MATKTMQRHAFISALLQRQPFITRDEVREELYEREPHISKGSIRGWFNRKYPHGEGPWDLTTTTCPGPPAKGCGLTVTGSAAIVEHFGLRYGGTAPQSYCRSCRSSRSTKNRSEEKLAKTAHRAETAEAFHKEKLKPLAWLSNAERASLRHELEQLFQHWDEEGGHH